MKNKFLSEKYIINKYKCYIDEPLYDKKNDKIELKD